jgi:ribosomal protein L11 methyltransferase
LNFFEVKIKTSADGIDPVCGRLLCLGITGFEIKDPNDFKDFLEHKTGNWDYIDDELLSLQNTDTEVICYLADNDQGLNSLAEIIETIGELKVIDSDNKFGELTVISDKVREEDWADNWKQYFKPFSVGETLLIKPSWEETPKTARKIVEIDPGSSFGTGQHASTKLCLELFERYRGKNGEDTVLDLGTGSGILSAAAAVLGVSYIKAVDIDENAVRTADENIAKNIKNSNNNTPFDTACGNVLTDESFAKSLTDRKYNVIFANIVADVLIAMSPLFINYLEKDGVIIMSGIISERAFEVINAMTAEGYILKEKKEENDWAALVFAI